MTTIAINQDDAKWNWLLKYHDEIEYTNDEILTSVIYQLDQQLENARFLLGEVISVPEYKAVPYSVKKRIFTFLTKEEYHDC